MYKVDFGNIVLDIQFVIGLIGLISGNSTINKDLPIKNNQARIIGFIFLLPLLSSLIGFTSWSDLLPAIASIGIALIYLTLTSWSNNSKVYRFWFTAMMPVFFRVILSHIPNVWYLISDFNSSLPFYGIISTYFIFIVFELLISLSITFIATLIIPVVTTKSTAFLFAAPSLLFHIHFSVMYWLALYFMALRDPNGPFNTGMIITFTIDIVAGFIIYLLIAFTAWFGSNINTRSLMLKNRPT